MLALELTNVKFQYFIIVQKGMLAHGFVVRIVVVQRFSDQILPRKSGTEVIRGTSCLTRQCR